ncbi:MAG TPA: His/Gly/Thr/Pro-type tRNA ligase C-terminal domain-containing protein, partial [Burkholderiales bacterium]|nr:His/Gly/Thr/Pro-type tRNA ligase C-terminal domain-containing protein [Burkholderiales bacterium]
IHKHTQSRPGYLGPVGLPQTVELIADRAALAMSDFVCGANEPGFHYTGANFGRDLPLPAKSADIRNAIGGDPSPDGKGTLEICRGIEVGHIFQLRTKYSEAMSASFLDEAGKAQVMEMGCYGIGVSRIVAAAIEQGNDERGIVWPLPMAPFQVAIAPIGYRKNADVKKAADQIHDELQAAGVDVLLDDRDERPGVMFADLELLGIPYRVTIGDRGLKEGKVEIQARTEKAATAFELQKSADHLKSVALRPGVPS